MKKWIDILACAAAVCCFAACQHREEAFPGQTTLTATTESDDPETRTTLAPAGTGLSQVLWTEKDLLDVFMDGRTTPVPFSLVEGAGTKTGFFHGEGEASRYIAFYPHSMTPSLGSGETVRFTLPTTQEYAEGTFASGAFPMTAVASSNDLQFHNLCSVLRISMTGHNVVTSIVFRSNDSSAKVCGKASVSLSDPSNPVLQLSSDSCDSLVLSVPNVKLTETEDTHFFLVLPPQAYKGGFSVRIYSNERFMDKVILADFTMKRSRLHKADSFVFEPNGFDESTCLKGSGTQSDPFLIQSVPDLALLRDAVNAGSTILSAAGAEVRASHAFYSLTSDLDMSIACSKTAGKSWTPIGDDAHHFCGSFDGNGHAITHLYINARTPDQGLFGVIEAGVLIANLSVQGEVTAAGSYVSLLSGRFEGMGGSWAINNCSAEGSVKGANYVGGISGGGTYTLIRACVNRASVSGSNSIGGIAGNASWGASNCFNYGSISGTYNVGGILGGGGDSIDNCANFGTVTGGDNTGGIIGYHNYGWMSNCKNEGTVSGSLSVGGLSGYSRQGSSVWNDINRGSVSGNDNVGGICGWLSSNSGTSNLQNCVNLGEVTLSGGSGHAGGICGMNEGPYGGYASACTATQNYWLYDPGKGLGLEAGIGLDEGISSNNFAMTEAQMKGAACDTPLYQGYNVIADALNGWAYDQRNRRELQGWHYSDVNGLPALTGLTVQAPGEEKALFSISVDETEVLASGGTIVVEVKSSGDYSIHTPGWIEETSVQTYETDRYIKRHTFTVPYNDSGSNRLDVISFTNFKGHVLTLKVRQKTPYLTVDTSDIILSADGGSKRIVVESSLPWTASSDCDWCVLSPSSGVGDGAVSVKVGQSEEAVLRTAVIRIMSTDGAVVHTIHVAQSGYIVPGEEDWKQLNFVHKSLATRFTATWCGWCPRMNSSIQLARELYPDKINYLVIHGGGSDLQFDDAQTLMNQYAIGGFPEGIVDGRVLIENYSIDYAAQLVVNAVKETEETYGTVTGIDITSSISGRKANVDVGVYLKKSGSYKITVLLCEDGIINAQRNFEGDDYPRYVHDNVARIAMTQVLGDSFTAEKDLTVKTFSFQAEVPSSYDLNNMHVLVYVQRSFASLPVIQSGNYGSYFVDNSAEVALGNSLRLALEGGGGHGGGDGNEGIVSGDDIDM